MNKSILKSRIQEDMTEALKAREIAKLSALRLLWAAIRQSEIDKQTEIDDEQIISIIDRLVKQRRDSIEQYQAGERPELAAREAAEIVILQAYLPQPLSEAEINRMVNSTIAEINATSQKDIGKVMKVLQPKIRGRADMAKVALLVKSVLKV